MDYVTTVLDEIQTVMTKVDMQQLITSMTKIQRERRIFVLGAGRSGFMAKSFAMRMMHIGYNVYVMGETITPSIQAGDLLITVSGSGKTGSVVETAQKAHTLGLEVIGITSDIASPLAEISDDVIIVPGATKTGAGVKSVQLLSTLFDQTVHITLDILTLMLSKRDQTSNEDALHAHVNVE